MASDDEEAAGQTRRRVCEIGDAKVEPPRDCNEKLRSLLYRVAHKHLGPGDWKRLAMHWAFTDEQIHAIEHQYTGNAGIVKTQYYTSGSRIILCQRIQRN